MRSYLSYTDRDGWHRDRTYHVVPELSYRYDVIMSLPGSDNPLRWDDQTREETARLLRTGREIMAEHSGVTLALFRHVDRVERHRIICSGCDAREVTWEYDCDGYFPNVTCDDPQCDWWGAYNAREADRERTRNQKFAARDAKFAAECLDVLRAKLSGNA